MRGYWTQLRINHGELMDDGEANEGRTDLYLTEIREWHSADGQSWERQPNWYEVYTGGTKDAISRHTTEAEALATYGDEHPGLAVDSIPEPEITATCWAVDDAGIRRPVDKLTEPDDDDYRDFFGRPDLVGATEAAQILGWDRRKLSTYHGRGLLPKPVADLAATPVWRRSDIEDYAHRLTLISWRKLRMVSGDGYKLGPDERIAALREFRRTGGMVGTFFEVLDLPHEDLGDASTFGPASAEDVDWTGFPQ